MSKNNRTAMSHCKNNEKRVTCEIIGIAGNIGAGKSIVSRILRCNGFVVYDCDMQASILMNGSNELRRKLAAILGNECYLSDGNLNRTFVSSRIFSDESLRREVNSLVHTAVKDDFIKVASLQVGKIFVESAVMATSGLDKLCNRIWVVEASKKNRLKRVMSRNNLTEKEVLDRMNTQKREISSLPAEKVVIIDNDDNTAVLEKVLRLAYDHVESVCFEISL